MPTIMEVEDAVSTVFAAAIGSIPIAWDNVEFDTDGVPEWVRFTFDQNGGTNPEIEGKQFRRFGILTVQIFVPSATGKRRAREIAEIVLATFEGQTIGEARFRNVGLTDVGVDDRWYQSNVTAEVEFDQFR